MKFPVGTRSVLFGAHCFFIHPWFVALAWWKLFGFPRDPRLWAAFFVHDLGYWGLPNMDGDEGERHVEWGAEVMHRWFDSGLTTQTGMWEVVGDADNAKRPKDSMVRVRWSLPNERGEYLYVAHYPATGWGWNACESQAREWNREGKMPWEFERGAPSTTEVPNTQWRDFCLYHSRFYAKRDGVKPSRLCIADKLAVALEPWWLYLPRVILSGEIREYMAHAAGNGKEGEFRHMSKYEGEPEVEGHDYQGQLTKNAWCRRMQAYLRAWVEEHKDGRDDTWTPSPKAP